ncbi:tRNA (adenosine(37)-N6)-threonylcarbamoyltransferase complex dimerization subunit type 1 TsaB [Companilactobacillus metriopterae]|uniref:tRNA (adenosine(37)-N6)-threonylcarbamoyltransferase complex dimerization subunit type 1 TsaB n=1 Tax=Companilactobacillus metriopterae TaxID=1909267 RepID=UPI00100BF3B9|nr:tRNA (adenosine(37)-N6)-threonylcarbamoyltransferase complex dimerization subunit type 1 TsaB [Companilactobacillus metriopterae]
MKVLAFDTSNKLSSIAIVENQLSLAEINTDDKLTHSINLLPNIQKLLDDTDLDLSDIDRVVVAQGPGSYTGLRIAVTVAKTLAYTLEKELVGISSLKLLAANAKEGHISVALMDARNDNVFAGVYQSKDGSLDNLIEDQHVSIYDLLDKLKSYREEEIDFVNVSDNLLEIIKEAMPKANILDYANSKPDAVKLAKLGEIEPPVADVNTFVPTYLRVTQAEYDWLQKDNHTENGNISYVEEI